MTYRTKIIALSTAVVLLTIHAIAFTDVRGVIAQGQNRMPMLSQIVNTDDDPVPVEIQGTGQVSGSVNAAQDGDWTVSIDPNANTVQVEDGLATRELFQVQVAPIAFGDGPADNVDIVRFTVPEGQRLVIEHVSAEAFMGAAHQQLNSLRIETDPIEPFAGDFAEGRVWYHMPMTEIASNVAPAYAGTERLTLNADGGSEVLVIASVDGNVSEHAAHFFVTLTGYLVDLPD